MSDNGQPPIVVPHAIVFIDPVAKRAEVQAVGLSDPLTILRMLALGIVRMTDVMKQQAGPTPKITLADGSTPPPSMLQTDPNQSAPPEG